MGYQSDRTGSSYIVTFPGVGLLAPNVEPMEMPPVGESSPRCRPDAENWFSYGPRRTPAVSGICTFAFCLYCSSQFSVFSFQYFRGLSSAGSELSRPLTTENCSFSLPAPSGGPPRRVSRPASTERSLLTRHLSLSGRSAVGQLSTTVSDAALASANGFMMRNRWPSRVTANCSARPCGVRLVLNSTRGVPG